MAEERELHKTLRWPDGVVLVMGITSGLFTSIGYTIGAIGAWTAIAVWVGSCVIGVLQSFIYSEMATMFPNAPGGIAMYAHEGWKRYSSLVGPTAANGYYIAWSFTLAIVSLVCASLIKAQFFASSTWTIAVGPVDAGLEHFIAAGICIGVYAVNVAGLRPAMVLQWILMLGLGVIVIALGILPWFHGGFSLDNLHWSVGGSGIDWKVVAVFFYLSAWTAYGSEIVATYGPEFKNSRRDVPKSMIIGALVVAVLYFLVPAGAVGTVGETAVAGNPEAYAVAVFEELIGPAAGVVTILLVGVLLTTIISGTGDAGRVLYGMAKDDMTITQLKPLNRRGVPMRQMTVDLIMNLIVLFCVGSPLAILFAANLSYVVVMIFAVSAFLLLRKDRPDAARPIRLPRPWLFVAAALVALNSFLLVVGASNPGLAGYGGAKEVVIALLFVLAGPVLYIYRRVVQDREPFRWRLPDDEVAAPEFEPVGPDRHADERPLEDGVGA